MFKKYLKIVGFVSLVISMFVLPDIFVGIGATVYHYTVNPNIASEILLDVFVENSILFSTVGGLGSIFIYWLFFLRKDKNLLSRFSFKTINYSQACYSFVMGAGIYLFFSSLIDLTNLEAFFPEHQILMEQIMANAHFVVLFLGVGIIVPIAEEIAFRGLIFKRLSQDFSLHIALILQAIVFGLMHLNVLQSSYAFIAGIFLGLVYIWSGSILAPIILHISWNSVSVIINSFIDGGAGTPISLLTLTIGLITTTLSVMFFKKHAISYTPTISK